MNLVMVVAPHFVAGLLVDEDDRVMQTAPILAYMRGWEGDKVRAYVAGKGWSASRVVNGSGATVGGAANVAAQQEADMSQQWPNPNDPSTPHPQPIQTPPDQVPGAPHTPESPRQTPEPGDGDEADSEA